MQSSAMSVMSSSSLNWSDGVKVGEGADANEGNSKLAMAKGSGRTCTKEKVYEENDFGDLQERGSTVTNNGGRESCLTERSKSRLETRCDM